ncbi:hypothetical protein ACFQX4_28370, partial [Roseomonas sp. GCM10028921]
PNTSISRAGRRAVRLRLRFKRVISGGLHSRTDGRRATEVAVAVRALNRMLEHGRLECIRIT